MPDEKKLSIRQDIRTSADYHAGGRYAFGAGSVNRQSGVTGESAASGVLSYYSSLELDSDDLAGQFIPLSAVPQRGRNPKIFAIGILPPNQRVTGKLLDRSATSIKKVEAGGPTQEDLDIDPSVQTFEEDIRSFDPPGNVLPQRVADRNNTRLSGLDPNFRKLVEEMIRVAAQQGIQLVITSGFRTAEEQAALYAKGRTAPGPKVTNAKAGQSWHNYGLAVDFAVFNGTKTEIPNPPPASVLQEVWGPIGQIGQSLGMNWGASYSDYPHFDWHPGINIASAAQGARPGEVTADTRVHGDFAGDPNAWADSGSRSAQKSRKQQSKLANTDLRATPLGLDLEAAQKAHTQAIQNALKAMSEAPPLRMLINPSSFAVKSTKIVQDGNWGRDGPIIEFWGDDQDKISGSGKVAGFYAVDTAPGFNGGGPGLARSTRNFSRSWQNFQALWLMYKNNGGVYLQDLSTQDKRTVLSTVGSVYIYYDNILYIGAFDSFNITESADKPFTVEYSFEFTVRAAFLLDQPPEVDPITNRQALVQNASRDVLKKYELPTRSDIAPTSPVVQQYGVEEAGRRIVGSFEEALGLEDN